MTAFIAARSIPLGETTRAAVKEHNGVFVKRDRPITEYEAYLPIWARRGYEFFWNMGHSELNLNDEIMPIYNQGETVVKPLLTPESTRELLGDLMPPQTGEREFIWLKEQGRGGRNKHKVAVEFMEPRTTLQGYWEDHIEGQEYRVITVGQKRVQQFRRDGDNANRQYTWIAMSRLPRAVKSVVREASTRLPDNSIIAWDLVQERGLSENSDSTEGRGTGSRSQLAEEQTNSDSRWSGQCYILEGNTSPGLTTFTVGRILKQIRSSNNAR